MRRQLQNDVGIMLANNTTYLDNSMRDEEFFQELGARVATLRQHQGWSQVQLAEKLGLKQQALATYETATRRIPSSLLVPLSDLFGITLDELLGVQPTRIKGKPGPPSRFEKLSEKLGDLPRQKQKAVVEILEGYLKTASS